MNDWTALDRFLHTDPHDVGCEQAMELLHVYVDLVAADIAASRALSRRRRPPGCLRAMLRGLRRAARRGVRFGQLIAGQWTASPREATRDG